MAEQGARDDLTLHYWVPRRGHGDACGECGEDRLHSVHPPYPVALDTRAALDAEEDDR